VHPSVHRLYACRAGVLGWRLVPLHGPGQQHCAYEMLRTGREDATTKAGSASAGGTAQRLAGMRWSAIAVQTLPGGGGWHRSPEHSPAAAVLMCFRGTLFSFRTACAFCVTLCAKLKTWVITLIVSTTVLTKLPSLSVMAEKNRSLCTRWAQHRSGRHSTRAPGGQSTGLVADVIFYNLGWQT